jgi:hypothetical protein
LFEHTVVRELPVTPPEAYGWLTDYREDDPEKVLGDPEGVRKIERLGPDRIRLQSIGVIAGVKGHADGTIVFHPPDRWTFDGHVSALGRKMVHVDAEWKVEGSGIATTRFTARFVVRPLHLLSRLYLRFLPGRSKRRIEKDYDLITDALQRDLVHER